MDSVRFDKRKITWNRTSNGNKIDIKSFTPHDLRFIHFIAKEREEI